MRPDRSCNREHTGLVPGEVFALRNVLVDHLVQGGHEVIVLLALNLYKIAVQR